MKTNLINLRKSRGFNTCEDFANALNIDAHTLRTWEDGTASISLENACNLCRFLGCSLDELADISNNENLDFETEEMNQPKLLPNQVQELLDNIGTFDVYTQQGIALRKDTPPEVLEFLSKNEDMRVRENVALNPNTPPDVLCSLFNEINLREYVTYNPSCPTYILNVLGFRERRDIATRHPRPDMLEELSIDDDWIVREAVAKNPSIPIDILENLSHDEHYAVRTAVAENPSTPIESLQSLSVDEFTVVREAVASNPSTPPSVLESLAHDEDYHLRITLASNTSCPPDVLNALSTNQEAWVRAQVASNPSTPPNTLLTLVYNKKDLADVRQEVAQNPSCPKYLSTIINSNDPDFDLREQLISFLPWDDVAKLTGIGVQKTQPTVHHVAHAEPKKEKKLTPKQDADLVRQATSGVRTTAQNHSLRK